MATKSKFKSLSARRSPLRIRLGAVSQPNSTPRTFPKSTPGIDWILQTPLFSRSVTPGVVGTPKSVSLSDWWLTKKTKNVLGIAGYESKGGSEVRVFSSGPISKRHHSTTLETLDGITVHISGFLNRSRTLLNGFPPEVCNRFLLGFPYNWEEEEEEESVEVVNERFTGAFGDIPVPMYQDILSTSSTCLRNQILDRVVNGLRDVRSSKKLKKPRMEESVGVKTRGMLRRGE